MEAFLYRMMGRRHTIEAEAVPPKQCRSSERNVSKSISLE